MQINISQKEVPKSIDEYITLLASQGKLIKAEHLTDQLAKDGYNTSHLYAAIETYKVEYKLK
jgi:hypothetical protein